MRAPRLLMQRQRVVRWAISASRSSQPLNPGCVDDWLCAAVCDLQARAADFPAVGKYRKARAGSRAAGAICFLPAKRIRATTTASATVQRIIHLSKYSDLQGSLVFIENYDIHVARQMVSGCDVWLNNPRRPLEASGTSGMKAGCHGCLNLSILDGWWREGYDGTNGFAIGEDAHADSVEEQDRQDSANLYKALTTEVIPLFYQRDAQGVPRQWLQRVRRAMSTLVPQFTTSRMVKEYTEKYYKTK